jgi:hypothetical protein
MGGCFRWNAPHDGPAEPAIRSGHTMSARKLARISATLPDSSSVMAPAPRFCSKSRFSSVFGVTSNKFNLLPALIIVIIRSLQ